MKAKDKALDLVATYAARLWEITHDLGVKPTPLQVRYKAKECALFCVDEIINILFDGPYTMRNAKEELLSADQYVVKFCGTNEIAMFWMDVKKELELL